MSKLKSPSYRSSRGKNRTKGGVTFAPKFVGVDFVPAPAPNPLLARRAAILSAFSSNEYSPESLPELQSELAEIDQALQFSPSEGV